MQRPHVVQPVGQFDQQHADVLAHRQEELAQVFSRALGLTHRLDLRKLGHPVDQPGHFRAEQPLDLLDRRQRILDRIVEQRGDDGFLIELELGHQPGHLDRVAEIGIAAGAFLGAVLLHGVDIGPVEHRLVRIGIIGEHPFNKFILAQHRGQCGGRGGRRARDFCFSRSAGRNAVSVVAGKSQEELKRSEYIVQPGRLGVCLQRG